MPSEISFFTSQIKNLSRESKRKSFHQENKKKEKNMWMKKKIIKKKCEKSNNLRRERNYVRKRMFFSDVYTIDRSSVFYNSSVKKNEDNGVPPDLASLTRKLNGLILRKCTLFPVAPRQSTRKLLDLRVLIIPAWRCEL